MLTLLPSTALLATLLAVQSPASRACSTWDYADAVIGFANFLACSDKDPADIQDFFETEGIEELVDCINTDDVTDVNASCVSDAAEQILDDFEIDSFFDELQNISAALDLPCSCTYELDNIDSDCLDKIGDQYGTPSMSTTVEYLEQVCDVFDYMEDCAYLEDAQDECMKDFDTMSEMCEFYIVPINEPIDLIDMMDRDDDDASAIKYGCTFVMNMAVRMPDSFVSDCEASNPSLNISRLQEVCEPYTKEPGPTSEPTPEPTPEPTHLPTPEPTPEPTSLPFPAPTPASGPLPTYSPTPGLGLLPFPAPTPEPSLPPTYRPTSEPTNLPSPSPSPAPTYYPTPEPTNLPSPAPYPAPTQPPSSAPTALTSGAIYEVSCQSSFSLNSTSNETLSNTEKEYFATVFAESSQLVDSPDDVRVQGKRSSSAARRALLSGGTNNFVVTFTFNVSTQETDVSTFTNDITDELLDLFNSTEFEETLDDIAEIQGVEAGEINVEATETLVAESVTVVVVVIVTEAPTTAPSFVPTAAPTTSPTTAPSFAPTVAPTTLPTADNGGRDDDDDDFPLGITIAAAAVGSILLIISGLFCYRRYSAREESFKTCEVELEGPKATQDNEEADQQAAPQSGPAALGKAI